MAIGMDSTPKRLRLQGVPPVPAASATEQPLPIAEASLPVEKATSLHLPQNTSVDPKLLTSHVFASDVEGVKFPTTVEHPLRMPRDGFPKKWLHRRRQNRGFPAGNPLMRG